MTRLEFTTAQAAITGWLLIALLAAIAPTTPACDHCGATERLPLVKWFLNGLLIVVMITSLAGLLANWKFSVKVLGRKLTP